MSVVARRCARPPAFVVLAVTLLAVSVGAQVPAAPVVKEAQEKVTLRRVCQQLDLSADRTLQSIRDRTDCWKRMQLQGFGDPTVEARYNAAVADYDAAAKSDSVRQASGLVDGKLGAAQRAMQLRDLGTARRLVDEVLTTQPDNQRGIAFRDRIAAMVRAQRLRNTLFAIAAGILVLGIATGAGARLFAARHERKLARERAELSSQRPMLEIIDGIGRGKMYEITGPVFRIGSAESDRPEEKNDLVLSDSGGFISRYHCTIVRKHGRYFLIDSSLNGTYMDEDLLDRGEHRPLEDGDEFTIAGMARVKFLII